MKFLEDVFFSLEFEESELHKDPASLIKDFSRFLAVSTTDKPVNRSVHAYAHT